MPSMQSMIIGRQHIVELLGLEEPTVSKKHAELHAILYDQEDHNVAPLVYVKCLSRNTIVIRKGSSQIEIDVKLTKLSPPHLLHDDDVLFLSPTVPVRIVLSQEPHHTMTDVQARELESLNSGFKITRSIGNGSQGTVHVAVQQRSGRQVACKIIDVQKYDSLAADEACMLLSEDRHVKKSVLFSPVRNDHGNFYAQKLKSETAKLLKKKIAQSREEWLIQRDLAHIHFSGAHHWRRSILLSRIASK